MKQIQKRLFLMYWCFNWKVLPITALALFFATVFAAHAATPSLQIQAAGLEYMLDEIIVQVDSTKTASLTSQTATEVTSQIQDKAARAVENFTNIQQAEQIGDTNFFKIKIETSQSIEQTIEGLVDDPDIKTAEPNIKRRITLMPDDPYLLYQFHLEDDNGGVDAYDAWDTQTGSTDIVVAVIDTGVDLDHPDLAANIWVNTGEIAGNGIDDDGNGYVDDVNGYDFVDDNYNPNPSPDGVDNDDYGGADTGVTHGTHVAGIVAAVGNNTEGVSGIAWTASIMALQVLDDEGSGADADIAEAIEYAVDNGADIIQMSLGGYGSTTVLENAIEYATDADVPVIAAVGNDGVNINNNPFYPACYKKVIGVGSVGVTDDASYFSNYGSSCVDLVAPGEYIYSTYYTGDAANGFNTDYGSMSGTSMATPMVSGAAVLLLSEDNTLSRSDLKDVLTGTAEDVGLSASYGSGRLDVEAAILGMDLVNYPDAPNTIKAYSSSSKKTQYQGGDRTTELTPYFTWSEPDDDTGVEGYYVYFGTDEDANPVNSGSFQIERVFEATLSEGNEVSYYLRIKAKDLDGNSSNETSSFEYIVDTTVKKPKNVKTKLTSNGIKITWNKVKSEHVAKYKILRRKLGSKKNTFKVIDTVKNSETEYIDKGVMPDATYRYKVRAVDDLLNKRVSQKRKITFYPRDRLVVTAGDGGGPIVGIYNLKKKEWEQSWHAFSQSHYFGLEVAVGNFDSDKKEEIVVAPTSGDARVRVLEGNGTTKCTWYAYDAGFTGGIRVAAADVDNDGVDEIVTGPGPGGGPHVKVFEPDGTLKWQFSALDGQFTGGIYVTGVNWDGKGRDEIAVAAGSGGGSTVVVYNPKTAAVLASWEAYDSGFTGGARLSSIPLQDGVKEAVVTVPEDGTTHVRRFKKSGASDVAEIGSGFFAFTDGYDSGAIIASGDLFQNNEENLIIGSDGLRLSTVQVYNRTGGTHKKTMYPFGTYYGAVHVAAGWVY